MLHVDRSASAEVPAAPARCLELLHDFERYPAWASLIASAERLDGSRVRLRARVLGIEVEMDCALETTGDGALLRRVPYDAGDEERYECGWTVAPAAGGSRVELHVVADLDAPGPARVLRGRVSRALVDDLLADFERHAGGAGGP